MEKSLLIRYAYKGKTFSVSFSSGKRNKNFLIGKKLVIGSDPNIYWQIFDNRFPATFDLVVEEGGKYYLNLKDDFEVSVSHGNEKFTKEQLKSKGLIKSNRILLEDGYEGRVKVNEDTEFFFSHVPITTGMTPEQKKEYEELHTFNKPKPIDMASSIAVITGIVAIIILGTIMGWSYVPQRLNIEELVKKQQIEASLTIKTEKPKKKQFKKETVVKEKQEDTAFKGNGEAKKALSKAMKVSKEEMEQLMNLDMSDFSVEDLDFGDASEMTDIAGANIGGDIADISSLGDIDAAAGLAVSTAVTGVAGNRKGSSSKVSGNVELGSDLDFSSNVNLAQADLGDVVTSSIGGVSATDIQTEGLEVASIGTDANIAQVQASIDKRKNIIAQIAMAKLEAREVKEEGIEITEDNSINLSNEQQKNLCNQWFGTLETEITGIYNTYTRNKVGAFAGKLEFRIHFKSKGKVKVKVIAKGSLKSDKAFIKEVQDFVTREAEYLGIDNYPFRTSMVFG